ncbi:MAG: hypothetical protein V4532_12645, partial [Pseudomonadota bacterium]
SSEAVLMVMALVRSAGRVLFAIESIAACAHSTRATGTIFYKNAPHFRGAAMPEVPGHRAFLLGKGRFVVSI